MAAIGRVIEGLEVLSTYTGRDAYPIYAEHDILCVSPPDPEDVSKEDTKLLKALGWFIDEQESWAIFV